MQLVLVAGCQENRSCSKVLNFLGRLDDRIRCTHEETVSEFSSVKQYEPTCASDALNWGLTHTNMQLMH